MSVANFIPTIWSARLLAHLDKAHVYGALVNRDYEGEIKNFGDTVKINQIGDVTIKTYTKGSDIADPDDLSGNQTMLTINQAKYFNFSIDDVDAAQTNPKLMDEAMQRAAYGMNDVTDTYIADLMQVGASNSGQNALGEEFDPIVPTSSTAYDYLVDLSTDLTDKNVPTIGRWVVVPAWFHGLLLKDQRFVGNGTDYNKALIEGGEVGKAAGFSVYLSNNVPNTSGRKYKIIAGTNQAASYAEQILKTEAYRPEKRFSDAVKGLHVYGAQVVQPKALSVLIADKAAHIAASKGYVEITGTGTATVTIKNATGSVTVTTSDTGNKVTGSESSGTLTITVAEGFTAGTYTITATDTTGDNVKITVKVKSA